MATAQRKLGSIWQNGRCNIVTHRTSGKKETAVYIFQDGVDRDEFNAPILMQIYSGETDRAGKQRDGAAI